MLSLSADQGPPPEGNIDHRRCIVHFDIDCFYAQVEEVLNPSLRGKPIGIKQKYLLVTCNYTARSLGVRKMESLIEAKRRCPSLVVMDGEDLTRYREASEAIFSYIAGVCGPLVQRLGMDEIFADVTALIKTTATTNSSGSGAAADNITGHLYAPGSGGTLLEAQTGLEISLNVDGTARAHRREGSVLGSPELESVEHLTVQAGGHGTSQESAEGSEGGTNATSDGSIGIERESAGRGSGDPPSGGGGGVRRGLGAVGVGGCRCGCRERLAATSAFAERVRTGLLEVVGYTCSAGIGCSKLAAKMAGELHKPHQQTTILPEHTMSMISQLPLRKLPGCGHSTCAKIKADLGITESRELQAAPWPLLVRAVGLKLARILFLLCRGEDDSPVVPSVRPKTMSDEDSFKRGSVRSRQQVEHHARRLATPLLLRVGERVRLHKEAPDTLRFGFRRASKGYGVRVTRQCAISSGVAAAWAAVAEHAAVAESETSKGMDRGSGVEGKGAPSNAAAVMTPAGGAAVSPVAPLRGGRGQVWQERPEQNGAAAEEGLSEVVRLSMSLFDRMVSPGEKLDLTLLSVGFAGFRNLDGTAQSGMARYLEPSQTTAAAGGGGSSSDRGTGNRGGGHSPPAASTPASTPYTSARTAVSSRTDPNAAATTSSRGYQTAAVTSTAEKSPSALEGLAAAPRAAAVEAASPSAAGAGAGASPAASSTGRKRTRILENPSRRRSPPQQQQEQREPQEPQHGDVAASEWEGAEILVVGQGGHDVPGRGSLDWCGVCGAHVLRTDAQEHYSSAFHRRRACDKALAGACMYV
eukprot:g16671.t1